MSPPELNELTTTVYADARQIASEDCVNVRNRRLFTTLFLFLLIVELLNEERFAQLVSADEGFDRPEADEHVLDFPVLINLLRRADHC